MTCDPGERQTFCARFLAQRKLTRRKKINACGQTALDIEKFLSRSEVNCSHREHLQ